MLTVKEEVLKALVPDRALRSEEIAEINTLGAALSLSDNDPAWGLVLWGWARFPRFDNFKTEMQVLIESISTKTKEDIAIAFEMHRESTAIAKTDATETDAAGGISGTPAPNNDALLAEIRAAITNANSVEVDQKAMAQAMYSALNAIANKKQGVFSGETIKAALKESIQDLLTYTTGFIVAVIIVASMLIGYTVGESLQSKSDQQLLLNMQAQKSQQN